MSDKLPVFKKSILAVTVNEAEYQLIRTSRKEVS